MKPNRPQFLRMKARFEEEPPPREICCPDYRHCLAEAAYKNYCLDCSLCPEAAVSILSRPPARPPGQVGFPRPLPAPASPFDTLDLRSAIGADFFSDSN